MHLLCFIQVSTTISASSYYDNTLTCAFKSHGQFIYWIIFVCDLQFSFRSSPAQLFGSKLFYIVHIERKHLGQPSTISFFFVTTDNNLIPCNTLFLENFSNFVCIAIKQESWFCCWWLICINILIHSFYFICLRKSLFFVILYCTLLIY